jgi:hypothetical protein
MAPTADGRPTAASDEFSFVHASGSYTCCPGGRHEGSPERWWWFHVSGDRQRYAPFRAADGDTEESVRVRVVAYYEGRLERRATPSSHWGSRRGYDAHTAQAAQAARIAKATT